MASNRTKDFAFKQFTITGGHAGMPVSTDGVMLGAWANFSGCDSLLDIGCGTGLLSLMAAQRYPNLAITAIDIAPTAIEVSSINFANSPWKERLSVEQADVLTWQPKTKFDAIICNPPYFNSGEHSANPQRAAARHSDSLPHTSLLQRCRFLLSNSGKASFILPVTEGEAFIEHALSSGWRLTRLCQVAATVTKPVNRLLIELGVEPITTQQLSLQQQSDSQAVNQSRLSIMDSGDYSQEFISLTKEFYLKF